MNRRALSALGDLVWVMVFIISAVFCYAFLYAGIKERYNDVLTSDDNQLLAGNAQYIANSLLNYKSIPGKTESSQGTFGNSVSSLATSYRSAKALTDGETPLVGEAGNIIETNIELIKFPETVDGSSYKSTLDTLFGEDSQFWKKQPDNQKVESVIISIRETGSETPIRETCIQYMRPGVEQDDACDPSIASVYFKALLMGAFPNSVPIYISINKGYSAEYGRVHVPTASGSASLLVTVVSVR